MGEVALFIDLENISTSLWKNYQQSIDAFKLMEKARRHGLVNFARAYGDFSQPHLQRLEADLRAAGIDKFDCPAKQRGEEWQSTVDSNIVIDLFEVALDRPGTRIFMLMAGDSDYIRVVTRLRHRLDKDVIIAGVPGSISRDLIRAAGGAEDPIVPTATEAHDEAGVIRIIARYEDSLPDGIYPVFNRMVTYVGDPRNAAVVDGQIVQRVLNDLVARGILYQEQIDLPDGRQLRVTELDRDHPEVVKVLGAT